VRKTNAFKKNDSASTFGAKGIKKKRRKGRTYLGLKKQAVEKPEGYHRNLEKKKKEQWG